MTKGEESSLLAKSKDSSSLEIVSKSRSFISKTYSRLDLGTGIAGG
jgi:hypothetical protein